jgi:hypothetical protein
MRAHVCVADASLPASCGGFASPTQVCPQAAAALRRRRKCVCKLRRANAS